MKNFVITALVAILISSCDKKSTETTELQSAPDSVVVAETNEPVESSTLQTCYIGVSGKDSVFVSLDDNLGTIIGKMRYKNFEKDSSFGDVSGTQNGDTLKLNYVFEAEGTTSDREIYFLRKDGNLIEGIGEHKVEADKDLYLDSGKLKYDGQVLKPVDCTDFEKKFTAK